MQYSSHDYYSRKSKTKYYFKISQIYNYFNYFAIYLMNFDKINNKICY